MVFSWDVETFTYLHKKSYARNSASAFDVKNGGIFKILEVLIYNCSFFCHLSRDLSEISRGEWVGILNLGSEIR